MTRCEATKLFGRWYENGCDSEIKMTQMEFVSGDSHTSQISKRWWICGFRCDLHNACNQQWKKLFARVYRGKYQKSLPGADCCKSKGNSFLCGNGRWNSHRLRRNHRLLGGTEERTFPASLRDTLLKAGLSGKTGCKALWFCKTVEKTLDSPL